MALREREKVMGPILFVAEQPVVSESVLGTNGSLPHAIPAEQEQIVVFSEGNKAKKKRKKSFVKRADRYFRREDTILARSIQKIAPQTGEAYTNSRAKRVLDLAIAIPMLTVSAPITYTLAGVNKVMYPNEPAFYSQDRVGHNGRTIKVKKIRTMVSGADKKGAAVRQRVRAKDDPDVTRFGAWLRKTKLDELPQLLLVVKGDLSMVGIRVSPQSVFDLQPQIWPEQQVKEHNKFYNTTPLGLTGINQIVAGAVTNDAIRCKTDAIQARNASLGNSMFTLWETGIRSAKLLK